MRFAILRLKKLIKNIGKNINNLIKKFLGEFWVDGGTGISRETGSA